MPKSPVFYRRSYVTRSGDKVQAGESLATIYANDPEKLLQAKERFLQAITIGEEKPAESMLIKQVIS